MMRDSLANLRLNYTQSGLLEKDMASHPFEQFRHWLTQAIAADILEPNAMTLATLSPEGTPIARIVLLKFLDEQGFVFFTNYNSAKGQQLQAHGACSAVFWWGALERQVRIEGQAEKIDPQESDAYFQSRPRDSQLGAWASPQSQVIGDRQLLETRLEEVTAQFAEQSIPRPSHWGGFRIIPKTIEFWQGRPSRLHDRIQYYQGGNEWKKQRLAP